MSVFRCSGRDLKDLKEASPTISDGVRLELFVRAGLAHSERGRVSDPAVRDRRAAILSLQQVEVVGHGCRVAHEPGVHGKAVLVPWPRQLTETNKV